MPEQPADKKSVVVVGAGIIGASIAVNLTRQGCKVTVLESNAQPARGATGKSWAWLNANRKEPAHYKELSVRSMNEWKKLPGLAQFPGTLYLGDKRDNDPRYPSRKLTKEEALDLQPGLNPEAAEGGAVLYEQEGFANAPEATLAWLKEAQQQGAEVHYSQEAVDFIIDQSDTITGVRTAEASYHPDVVVLAAGISTPHLAARAGVTVPLEDKPGTVNILTQPLPPTLNHIIVTDEAFFMQRHDGRILISFYKGVHAHPDPVAPPAEPQPEDFKAVGKKVMGQTFAILPSLRQATQHDPPEVIVGRYPYPVDAMPILGFSSEHPQLYIATMHSGATLGPIVGRLAGQEIATGRPLEDLTPYRPQRDFSDRTNLY